jgi:hypothetical protein
VGARWPGGGARREQNRRLRHCNHGAGPHGGTIQLTLPLRHSGLGLVHTGPEEGDAAYLSGVATTQIAVRHGPKEFRPFEGPIAAQLRRSPHSTRFRRLATETGIAAAFL